MLRQGLVPIIPFELASRFGSGDIVWPMQYINNLFLHKHIKKTMLEHIRANKIDAILAIDAPSFALSNARYLKRYFPSIPQILINTPPVWAWRKYRASTFAKQFDLLLSLLPFEPPLFSKYQGNCHFIGFPAAKPITPTKSEVQNFKKKYNLKDNIINLAYLPGSRPQEIQHLLPILAEIHETIVKQLPDKNFRAFIVSPENKIELVVKHVSRFWSGSPPTIIPSTERHSLYKKIRASVVASGTAALELSVARVPNIIIYKINPLLGFIIKSLRPLFIHTNHVGIINITASQYQINTPIPECIQDDCSANKVIPLLLNLIEKPNSQIKESQIIIKKLLPQTTLSSTELATKHIISIIKDHK